MTVVDAFVAVFDEATRAHLESEVSNIKSFYKMGPEHGASDVDALVAVMDECGVDLALDSGPMLSDQDRVLAECAKHPNRLRAALWVDSLDSIRSTCAAIEDLARSELVAAIRVIPLFTGEPINGRAYYPIYERCEGLGLPVTVNVGIPGPKVRGNVQDPMLLDDVLIDFPNLVVVAAHMGHPWEALLIRLMMKYENLYLSNSAYLARYMDPAVVRFMDSSRGRHKLIFASDEPLLPMSRALADANALDISDEAKANFLGNNALNVFRWSLEHERSDS